jgi:AraC family transcriptional regulator
VAVEIFGQAPSTAALPETMRDSDGGIATIAGVLARETATATPESAVYAEALGSMLAVHLMRHYSAGSASPASTVQRGAALPLAVARAARYIRDNLARDVRLADVARAAHVSPFHLTRQFKEAMGLSPYQYVLRERVNAAKAMLQAARSDLTLAELALAVGFADQSHLTRHFKRAVGVTPNAYRAQLAAGDAASRAVQ